MLQQQGRLLGLLHAHLEEALGAEGRVRRHRDSFPLRVLHQALLREVRVVFDLQGRGPGFGVAQQVHEEDAAEIAHSDAAAQPVVHELFHGRPRLLDARGAGRDVAVLVREAGRVFGGRVDVFERDGEVHDIEVEVVDAPVLQLLLADGLHARTVVEGVPELGDEEEVGALAEVVFQCTGDALAGFDFVAVVWRTLVKGFFFSSYGGEWVGRSM